MPYPPQTRTRLIQRPSTKARGRDLLKQMIYQASIVWLVIAAGFFGLFNSQWNARGIGPGLQEYQLIEVFTGADGGIARPEATKSIIVQPQSGLRSAKLFRSFAPERSRSQRTFQAEFKMATIFSVSTAEELKNALVSAKGGDTIKLAGGDYGQLDLITSQTFGVKAVYDSPVTITSADFENPALFTGIDLRGVQNLTFDNVTFDSNYTGGTLWVSQFKITDSTGIKIQNSIFQGEIASGTGDLTIDGYATGKGLTIQGGSNIVIENNEFSTWHRALTVGGTTDVVISGNDIHSIRSDGMNFVGVQNLLIEDNYIHDFVLSKSSGDHADMIQFWTTNTTSPSTNVIIRGNTLDIGDGDATQSIFIRNEEVDLGRAGAEMFYQNFLIENNTIYNAHTHGITVGETNGLTIQNNTVLRMSNDVSSSTLSVTVPKINVSPNSTSVTIEGNISSAINGFSEQITWSLSGNALVQPLEYLDNFVTSTLDPKNGVHEFVIAPGSHIEEIGAGSEKVQFPYTVDIVAPYLQVYSDPSSSQSLIFDASLTVGPLGVISADDAQFLWTFTDGSTASGQIVKNDFASAGFHDVMLAVKVNDGTMVQAIFTAKIAGSDIVSFDPLSGSFFEHAYGESTVINSPQISTVDTESGRVIDLGASGVVASVAKEDIQRFFGAEAFEMSMTLQADTFQAAGEVVRIHNSFLMKIDKDGALSTTLWTNQGSVMVKTSGVKLNDGQAHDIVLRFDASADRLEVLVNGEIVGSAHVPGYLEDIKSSGLMFGNPWGDVNFDGKLSAFSLKAEALDFPTYTGTAVTAVPLQATQEVTATTEPATTDGSTGNPETSTENDTEFSEEPKTNTSSGEGNESGGDDASSTDTETLPKEDSGELESPTLEPEIVESGDQTSLEDAGSTTFEREESIESDGASTVDPFFLHGGYKLNITNIQDSGTVSLIGDTHVIQTEQGSAITFDGKADYAHLGRLTEFEQSQRIAFSVDFESLPNQGVERLVWNHMKIGLSLEGDGIRVHVANTDAKFHHGFQVSDLGLDDGELHNVTVMVDAETDRLQIVVDDVLVLDEKQTDFEFVGVGGNEWGWSLGTAWNRWFEGEVYGFQVSDDFSFIEQAAVDDVLVT